MAWSFPKMATTKPFSGNAIFTALWLALSQKNWQLTLYPAEENNIWNKYGIYEIYIVHIIWYIFVPKELSSSPYHQQQTSHRQACKCLASHVTEGLSLYIFSIFKWSSNLHWWKLWIYFCLFLFSVYLFVHKICFWFVCWMFISGGLYCSIPIIAHQV